MKKLTFLKIKVVEKINLEELFSDVKGNYLKMTPEEREIWFNKTINRLDVGKYLDINIGPSYSEEQIIKINAFRKCVDLVKTIFINGLTKETMSMIYEYETLWKENQLDKGL